MWRSKELKNWKKKSASFPGRRVFSLSLEARLPLLLAEILLALEEAAVDEKPTTCELDEMIGSGDRAGPAERREGNVGHGCLFPRR